MKKLIFYAPLGYKIPEYRIGGAECGCRRTLTIYQEVGIDVIAIDKPFISRGKTRYAIESALLPFKLAWILFRNPQIPIHIVGFYCQIAWYELILMSISRFMGHKVAYELRNGNMVKSYQNGSKLYRWILKQLLTKPQVVLCQGMEFVDMIKQEWGIVRDYYPNSISNKFLSLSRLPKKDKAIQLIYFGRITQEKRVDIIIEVLAELLLKGYEAHLDIIGSYTKEYYDTLQEVVEKYEVRNNVVFYGRRDIDFIVEKLLKSHYFLFPSQNELEGHSNSLTEAMGCGVVPIVSEAGFNRSICGDDNLVIEKYDAKCYADKIIEIEESGIWGEYSKNVKHRIEALFSENTVATQLLQAIDKLYN